MGDHEFPTSSEQHAGLEEPEPPLSRLESLALAIDKSWMNYRFTPSPALVMQLHETTATFRDTYAECVLDGNIDPGSFSEDIHIALMLVRKLQLPPLPVEYRSDDPEATQPITRSPKSRHLGVSAVTHVQDWWR